MYFNVHASKELLALLLSGASKNSFLCYLLLNADNSDSIRYASILMHYKETHTKQGCLDC